MKIKMTFEEFIKLLNKKDFDCLIFNHLFTNYDIVDRQLIIHQSIDLPNIGLTELPDNMTIEGNFNISHNNLKTLPKNLEVQGNLDITCTDITTLSGVLKVEKDVLCSNNFISLNLDKDSYIKGIICWKDPFFILQYDNKKYS